MTASSDDFPKNKIKEGLVELKWYTILNCLDIDGNKLILMRNLVKFLFNLTNIFREKNNNGMEIGVIIPLYEPMI